MGYIFDIQRFCIHDGPGIRTTVFFKGCPLRCQWCHNPEGLETGCQLMYSFEKCIACGSCVNICKSNAHRINNGKHFLELSKCSSCMKCTKEICPAEALKPAGIKKSAESIIHEVLSDIKFFNESGGGLTLSGGEPFFQPDFALEILKKAKDHGLHTAVETSGMTSSEVISAAVKYTDLFLYDYKITGEEAHKKFTKVSQKPIIENLNQLNTLAANIILRCPIIPGINTTDEHYMAIGDLTNKYKRILKVNLMPYHSIGVGKYEKLGMKSPFSAQTMNYDTANKIKNEVQKYCSVEVEII